MAGRRKKLKRKERELVRARANKAGDSSRLLILAVFLLAAVIVGYFYYGQPAKDESRENFCSDSPESPCHMGAESEGGEAAPKSQGLSNALGVAGAAQNKSNSSNYSAAQTPQLLENKSRDQLLFEEINPQEGIPIAGRWLDIGPKIVRSGALNYSATEAALRRNGYPMTPFQREILLNGSGKTIIFDRNNSLFLLYTFWAFGLANSNRILENGTMSSNKSLIPYYASTGAWTLGNRSGGELFSSSALVSLDGRQQALAEKVAGSTYRPCCDNPTAFPDCNHGMAALGLIEWLAYQNASEEEVYSSVAAANSYWFAGNYLALNAYFSEQGRDWKNVSARELLSKKYSSYSGYSSTIALVKKMPGEVRIPGCGV
ncbi:MAG: hypothetical protein QW568_04910 [Candidatus Anstonellaceae archaeon]